MTCTESKPLSEFHKHPGRRQGVTNRCKVCRNIYVVEKRYGLAAGDLYKLKKSQDFKCKICGIHDSIPIKGLAVDHCHTTGAIRGLLCTNCNNGIGRFKDNVNFLENALIYLKEFKNV